MKKFLKILFSTKRDVIIFFVLLVAIGGYALPKANGMLGARTPVINSASYLDLTGDLSVGGTATIADMIVTNDATIGNDLTVTGDTTMETGATLGGVYRTTWPTGTSTGAFNDGGTFAYYNGGNVGIGDSTPTDAKLKIVNAGATAGIFLDQNSDERGLYIDSEAIAGDSYGLYIITGQGAAASRFASGPSTFTDIARDSTNTTGNNLFYRDLASASTGGPLVTILDDNAGDDQDALSIKQDGTGNYLTAGNFVIDDEGNVGIGTDSPDSSLHILSTAGANDADLKITSSGGPTLWFEDTGESSQWNINVGGSGPSMNFLYDTTGDIDPVLSLTSNRFVGIGTASPDTKLEVVGAITQSELSADPSDPAEGKSVTWQSDGTGSGDDGDLMVKLTAGGVTKITTLIDFSEL